MSVKPWVKVWRPRHGSAFEARLSGPAKMLFCGMLRLLDEDGRMALAKHEHAHQALGITAGYTKNERRALKSQLAEIEAHGCVTLEQDVDGYWTLTAPSWSRFQDAPGSKVAPRSVTGGSKVAPRLVSLGSKVAPRSVTGGSQVAHEITPKCAESLAPKIQEGEGELEGDGEGEVEEPLSVSAKASPAALALVPPSKPKTKRKLSDERQQANRETWKAYAKAYEKRYRVPPIRNAAANGMISRLTAKLAFDEAPHVARFYLEHNGPWYVTKGHGLKELLGDAEKIRTEWATGRKITRGDSENAEVLDELQAKSARVKALMDKMGIEDR